MARTTKTGQIRTGRPRKNPELGKRVNVMFRLNEVTRDKAMRLASEAGRSMSEELEQRIIQSIENDGRLFAILELLQGSDLVMFATLINGNLRLAIEEADRKVQDDKRWFENNSKIAAIQEDMATRVQKAVETFAGMCASGTSQRVGQHVFADRGGFPPMRLAQSENDSG